MDMFMFLFTSWRVDVCQYVNEHLTAGTFKIRRLSALSAFLRSRVIHRLTAAWHTIQLRLTRFAILLDGCLCIPSLISSKTTASMYGLVLYEGDHHLSTPTLRRLDAAMMMMVLMSSMYHVVASPAQRLSGRLTQ